MNKRIIDIAVVVVLAVIANFSVYKNLKDAADDMNVIIQAVQAEIISWQEEVAVLDERLNVVQLEFHRLHTDMKNTIDRNIAVADSTLGHIDSTLGIISRTAISRIDSLKATTDKIESRIKNLLTIDNFDQEDEIEKNVKQIIPGIPGF